LKVAQSPAWSKAIAAFAGGDHPLTLRPAGEAVGRRFGGDGERHRSSPLPPAADALRAHLLQSAENQSQYRLRQSEGAN